MRKKQRVLDAIALAIRWSGVALVVRNTIARRRVSILLYHGPSPATLERHLRYLTKRYRVIELSELVDALETGQWNLPPKPIVITVDDGLKESFHLLEVFRRHAVKPTIYICTQLVGTKRRYWFLNRGYDPRLRPLPEAQRLAALEQAFGWTRTLEYDERQALSREEIDQMAPDVDFQSHTRFHPLLSTCTSAESESELRESRHEVESLTGAPCVHFAFPNGDYTERELELLRLAGYRSARTLDVGWNGLGRDPYRLKILGTRDEASVTRLCADLTGITGYFARLKRGSLRGRRPPNMSARAPEAGRGVAAAAADV